MLWKIGQLRAAVRCSLKPIPYESARPFSAAPPIFGDLGSNNHPTSSGMPFRGERFTRAGPPRRSPGPADLLKSWFRFGTSGIPEADFVTLDERRNCRIYLVFALLLLDGDFSAPRHWYGAAGERASFLYGSARPSGPVAPVVIGMPGRATRPVSPVFCEDSVQAAGNAPSRSGGGAARLLHGNVRGWFAILPVATKSRFIHFRATPADTLVSWVAVARTRLR